MFVLLHVFLSSFLGVVFRENAIKTEDLGDLEGGISISAPISPKIMQKKESSFVKGIFLRSFFILSFSSLIL